jgi:DinB superfamily
MEECTECGYSYTALRRPDITPELRAQARRYVALLTTVDVGRLRAHVRADVWSPLEYACHVRDVHLVQEARVLQACSEEQPDFASMRREERVLEEGYNDQDATVVASEIEGAAGTLARTLDGLDDGGWSRTGVYHWPTTALRTVDWIGRHTVHESVHHLRDIDRLLDASP